MAAREHAGRLPLGAEIALAFATGAGAFALAGVVLAGVGTDLVVALLGVVYVAVVVAVARFANIAYAVPVGMAGILAYDWFFLPPTHPLTFPDSANLVDLVVYLGVAVLLGELAAHAARRAEAAERAREEIADEQAALRRVATLVAQDVPAQELFAAVAVEAGILLDVHGIRIARYEDETELAHVAEWSKPGYDPPAYDHAKLEGTSVSAEVLRTWRAARIDDYEDVEERASFARGVDVRSVVGAPIIVEGRRWGVLLAWSASGSLPTDMEGRLTEFAELVATAVSNTGARTGMAGLADEQVALRRVATLVAKAVPTAEVFEAVTREVGLRCDADLARMERFEPDGTVTAVAAWSRVDDAQLAVGRRFALEGESIATQVLATGRPARVDTFVGASGPIAHEAQALGIRASVGCPIVVGGRTWGVIAASTRRETPFPANTESRIADFTELVATAVSNAEAQTDLLASRARLLTASDDASRRVVRDLHDGAQQSLVQVIMTLRLIEHTLAEGDEAAKALVGEALDQAEQANGELRELAHGILPAVLARGGLSAGVSALVSRLRVPVEVAVPRDRFPPEIEASAYFVVAEALTNVAKHAGAQSVHVTARVDDGVLHVHVRDDGVGGARADGTGLRGLNDRVAAMDGRLEIESPPGDGTRIAVTLPLQRRPVL
ncbi:GAF domain-containing protein [Actinophytocola sp.]|uniref:GAF domain-containing protein n=1 Tax=Actinophytocola sp. TaxID=1872138 RepID=UPI002ED7984F